MPSKKDLITNPSEEGRRFLIAAGTAHYQHLNGKDLPSVVEDIRLIVECFEKLGYEQVLPELASNPTENVLRKKLGAWFADDERSPDDKVVFYYSGHGERYTAKGKFPRLYLLTSDTESGRIASTAYCVDTLTDSIFEPGRVHQGMIILDVCYAGHGVREMVNELNEWAGDLPEKYGFFLIAATRAKEPAYPGVFAPAFRAVIEEPRFGGFNQEWLDMGQILNAINNKIESEKQQAQWGFAPVAQRGELPHLLPNPRYDPHMAVGVDLDAQRYQTDLLEHWLPRARGVEAKFEAWYFTGREAVLRQIVAWLTAPRSDGKALVVTGSAGTGKSAILARLVILANPDYRDRIERAGYLNGTSDDTVPPKSSVDVAVHARRKTLHGIVEAIAEGVNVKAQDADELVEALAARTERLVIVVDALDEADESPAIARFLNRLTGNPHLWLLVGSRPNTPPGTQGLRVRNLGSATVGINLDDFPEISQQDIETYAFRRLLAKGERRTTPYQGQPEERVRTVAKAIGNKAKNVFLIARIVCEDLIKAEQPVDVSVPDWDRQFPTSIGDAFLEYLKRFDRLEAIGLSRRKVTDLLRPLAYAEGEGLPWESLWRPLADAIAAPAGTTPRRYKDTDIEAMLERAGAFVVESQENGRSAYRLYHQALAEYLREDDRPLTEIQSFIASTLIDLVPKRADGQPDWLNPATHPYIRTHLASHAAAARVLDTLVLDPGYLAVADPIRLVPALATIADGRALEVADVYRRIAHELSSAGPLERMALIHLEACKEAPALASTLEPLDHTAWRCRWAHWMSSAPHRIVVRYGDGVHTAAFGAVDGEPVVVSGGEHKTLRLWDVHTGQCHSELLGGHEGTVHAVALGAVADEPVLVSGGQDGTVRLWDARTGLPRGKPLIGHMDGVYAVTLGDVDGEQVVVSGGRDETVRLWDACSGMPRGEPLTGHMGSVHAVVLGLVDGEPVLVSGGHDGTVRLWDARTGLPRGEPLIGHTAAVVDVALGTVDGEPVVGSGSWDGTVRLWDARTDLPRGEPLTGHKGSVSTVALGAVDGEPVVVSGGVDYTVRLWDARTGLSRGEPMTGHWGNVYTLTLGAVDGEPVVVSGSWDGSVRLWDARTGLPRGEPLTGHTSWVTTVALGAVDGEPVVVSGSVDDTVRLWDARSHGLLGVVPLGCPVRQLVIGNDSEVAVGADRGLLVLDLFRSSSKRTSSSPTY